MLRRQHQRFRQVIGAAVNDDSCFGLSSFELGLTQSANRTIGSNVDLCGTGCDRQEQGENWNQVFHVGMLLHSYYGGGAETDFVGTNEAMFMI